MSTLEQFRHGLEQAWDNIATGWADLRQRAAHALTRFHPQRGSAALETAGEHLLQQSSRWGLLAADLRETDDALIVRLEVPGLESDQLDVSVVDNILLVRGDKQLLREQAHGNYYLMECAYGRFERAIPLPVPIDETQTRAHYRRGVLSIVLPKTNHAHGRRIAIHTP